MVKFSQNNEQEVLSEFFSNVNGHLLSIGENSGLHLSNCRHLLMNGWSGILVEPAPKAFTKLHRLYFDNPEQVWCFNVAISDYDGEGTFFESGSHLGTGDTGLLSTLKKSELDRWRGSNNQFNQTTTLVWTFERLQQEVRRIKKNDKYQFINIDAEGEDVKILQQIDLNEVDCQCLCIEHNSVLSVVQEIREYCAFFGLNKEIGYNQENIILAR